MDMELFFIYRYHIIPIFMGVGIAGLTGLLAWLVGKQLFKKHMRLFPRFQRFKANPRSSPPNGKAAHATRSNSKVAMLPFSFFCGKEKL